MKYVPPYGITDPNAPYINGNPQTGVQGSIPPAAAFEEPMREIVGVISNSGITPSDSDLLQMTKAIRSQALNFVIDGGTVNALVVACVPALNAYTAGLPLRVLALHTNTATVVTINAGAGTVRIKKMDGSDPAIGDIVAGGVYEVTYDGTNFQLTNFGGTGGGTGGGSVYTVNIPYVADTGTPNAIVAAFSPAITALTAGSVCLVKLANTVTGGPVTIAVNALPIKNIKVTDGSDPLPADVIAGDILWLKYDGTNFITDPDPSILVNCTFNVPSTQFPTTASVFEALKRKTISPSAYVTVQLGIGVFPPFAINHPNATQIIIKGTMKAAMPTLADFARTGNTSGARAADSATNIVMLRARYGSEVHFTNAANMNQFVHGYAVGITNLGPGQPTLQDILITGDNLQGWQAAGLFLNATRAFVNNVAVWGSGGQGFQVLGNGYVEGLGPAFCCGNFYSGFTGGNMKFWFPTISVGNAACGCQAGNGTIACVPINGAHHMECNGLSGGAATDAGMGGYMDAVMINNGANGDVWAYDGSHCYAYGATYGTTNPAPNVMGNSFAFIDTTHPDTGPW